MVHYASHKNALKEILSFLALFLSACVILSFFQGIGMIYFFFLFALYYIIISLVIRDIKSLEIDSTSQKIIITKAGVLTPSKQIRLDMQSLTYTYKKEAIAKFTSGKCLRLYIGEKRKIKLSRMDSGWEEDKIDAIVNDLDNVSIKRKFVGYALKDVFPYSSK